MKLNKKKVFTLALAVCLIAILSLGSLAWFTDDDTVTNDFLIAGSDDGDPDDVFSVDVWEKNDPNGEKEQVGFDYEDILPGDDLYKEVNVENTGAYDQYVRLTVTVTDAHIWQAIHGEVYVPLNKIATDLNANFETWSIVYDADKDTLTYVLYYNAILPFEGEDVVNVFTNVAIPEELDRYQAAEMVGGFSINVVAEAVQTKNVGNNAPEAFETVNMAVEAGNFTYASAEGMENALNAGVDVITLSDSVTYTFGSDVSNVTIDANGNNAVFTFTALAENVVITNIQDDPTGTTQNVNVKGAAAGSSVTVKDSVLYSNGSTNGAAIAPGPNCDLVVDNCSISRVEGKTYGLYNSGASGALTVTNCTFEGFTSWAIQVNNKVYGDLVIDGCTFNCEDGVVKVLSGVTGDFTFTNNTLVGCKGHDGKGEAHLISVSAEGTATESGNTLDGADWSR